MQVHRGVTAQTLLNYRPILLDWLITLKRPERYSRLDVVTAKYVSPHVLRHTSVMLVLQATRLIFKGLWGLLEQLMMRLPAMHLTD